MLFYFWNIWYFFSFWFIIFNLNYWVVFLTLWLVCVGGISPWGRIKLGQLTPTLLRKQLPVLTHRGPILQFLHKEIRRRQIYERRSQDKDEVTDGETDSTAKWADLESNLRFPVESRMFGVRRPDLQRERRRVFSHVWGAWEIIKMYSTILPSSASLFERDRVAVGRSGAASVSTSLRFSGVSAATRRRPSLLLVSDVPSSAEL